MKFFDRFKKKTEPLQPPEVSPRLELSPVPNTSVTIFFDRPDIGNKEIEKSIQAAFGAEAVLSVDASRPSVTHFMLRIDGIDAICSYMPFPYPKEECDIPALLQLNRFITEDEQKALVNHKSFCILTEIGGGKTLAGKRSVCRMLTKLCASLLRIDGAAGACCGAASLLLGKRMYLNYAAIHAENEQDPAYFPSILWVLAYETRTDDGVPTVETCGLAQFGFSELQFYHPREDWSHSFERLYLMAILQITGKEIYKNMDAISFSEGSVSVFKQCGEKLSVIGGI